MGIFPSVPTVRYYMGRFYERFCDKQDKDGHFVGVFDTDFCDIDHADAYI